MRVIIKLFRVSTCFSEGINPHHPHQHRHREQHLQYIISFHMALTVNFNRVVSLLTVIVKEKACLPALEEDPVF